MFRKINSLENKIKNYNDIKQSLQDIKDLYSIADKENDEASIKELLLESSDLLNNSNKIRYLTLLNDEADQNNAFLEIHAGAGGTESQDWAQMLQRMYVRWAESKEFNISLLQESKGEEAGIKSSTIKISGEYSYGWLKRESGIHRLVRISPFDSNKRRHTSFASIWVYPEVDETIEIEIKDSDLRIDTYRASGAGGQHVNKTDSAVRITHIPTEIVVQCQNDRSQHKNKSNAMAMLKSRLYELELQKRKNNENKINSEKKDIGWGNQIRSYVLHPYKLIKDLRTKYETSNVNNILDGDIDKFLEMSLTL
ncbi:MAG: Peptide chain release factor 2 [Alphaproteobacteria bacterium MarineAlpha5_Bin8]|nr:MAG: Peptide chain release factor 2 [Alphaproteobacteria bacterium MarineAlpha5_Bin7]PPR46791.1 MAG: Peptide chain release factor 2 [Alphaproteobacteria bacterium MarineAlpha5_Bin8]PPR53494.1 MAG: Peptide chain release factor 2 [Alphaproteobacteria bacterium MarineAlpha5_Bin6]